MPDKIRRIVTGHNDQAEAVVKIDEIMEPEVIRDGVALFTKVWTTDASPADNNDDFDGAARETGLVSEGGTVLRFVRHAAGRPLAPAPDGIHRLRNRPSGRCGDGTGWRQKGAS